MTYNVYYITEIDLFSRQSKRAFMKNYPNTECSVANTILLSKIDQRRIKRFVQYNQKNGKQPTFTFRVILKANDEFYFFFKFNNCFHIYIHVTL